MADMKKTSLVVLGFVVLLGGSLAAQAAAPRMVESYGDWDAYVFTENGQKVCYMAARPKTNKDTYKTRDDIHALITHRPSENTKNVFSYIAGYTYKPGSEATVQIDDQKFILFTQDSTAWAPDSETDEKLMKAIRGGSSMTVKGTSARGTQTSDVYSLKGSGAAHARISKECGI